MDWSILLGGVGIVVAVLLIKRLAFVPEAAARRHLANGALVIDVRSPQEFQADRVRGAINLPLGELRARGPELVPDRNQVLLVHCLSGGRSAIACREFKSMGYQQVFNLGSLARARKIKDS